jgi:hypothetical protein
MIGDGEALKSMAPNNERARTRALETVPHNLERVERKVGGFFYFLRD